MNGLNSWFDSGITEINGVVVRKRERKESRIISEDTWILVTTLNINNPVKIYELYELRTDIEERHKQLKVFWGINKFTTPDFALNVAHVFFTILAYSVIEFYFKKSHLKNLAAKTIKTLQYQECMGKNNVIVYVNDYFAVFDIMEYSRILFSLNDIAGLKLLKKLQIYYHLNANLLKFCRILTRYYGINQLMGLSIQVWYLYKSFF